MTTDRPIADQTRRDALYRYGIHDAAIDEDFDALARLAATVCATPMAMVGFQDGDGVCMKASFGLSPAAAGAAAAFSSVVTDAGRSIVVPDALCGGPLSEGPAQFPPEPRFLAGAPLTTPDGAHIGALCVMDVTPRQLDAQQSDSLKAVAQQVMTHLELRRNARVLAETVEELRAAEKTILHMAHHDALTGLPGRLLFHDRLEHALRHAQRHDEILGVMFLDLDGFKVVNDTHGHAAGDRLLQDVAARMQDALRRSDTVARMGGDEFAIVCADLRDAGDASVVADKLLAAVRSCGLVDGLPITASLGIAIYPYDGATAETLLCDADAAMYRAKRRGKNTYSFSAIVGRKGSGMPGPDAGAGNTP